MSLSQVDALVTEVKACASPGCEAITSRISSGRSIQGSMPETRDRRSRSDAESSNGSRSRAAAHTLASLDPALRAVRDPARKAGSDLLLRRSVCAAGRPACSRASARVLFVTISGRCRDTFDLHAELERCEAGSGVKRDFACTFTSLFTSDPSHASDGFNALPGFPYPPRMLDIVSKQTPDDLQC